MVIEKTQADKDALHLKVEHPELEVKCPRCGGRILYKEIGNSISVKCENQPCIFGGIRGL